MNDFVLSEYTEQSTSNSGHGDGQTCDFDSNAKLYTPSFIHRMFGIDGQETDNGCRTETAKDILHSTAGQHYSCKYLTMNI